MSTTLAAAGQSRQSHRVCCGIHQFGVHVVCSFWRETRNETVCAAAECITHAAPKHSKINDRARLESKRPRGEKVKKSSRSRLAWWWHTSTQMHINKGMQSRNGKCWPQSKKELSLKRYWSLDIRNLFFSTGTKTNSRIDLAHKYYVCNRSQIQTYYLSMIYMLLCTQYYNLILLVVVVHISVHNIST